MFNRVCSLLTLRNILHKYQSCFRQNHSTILALTEILDNIKELLDCGSHAIGIYLDLSKAFSTLNHDSGSVPWHPA